MAGSQTNGSLKYLSAVILVLIIIPMVMASPTKIIDNTAYHTGHVELSDLRGARTYLFNIAQVDTNYADNILKSAGWNTHASWESYNNIYGEKVLSTTLSIGTYKTDVKITESGYVLYSLMHDDKFPPLYNDTSNDTALIHNLMKKVFDNTGNVSVEFSGVSGELTNVSWGYRIRKVNGRWVSTKIPVSVNVTNPWNTYVVKIGMFEWPYKIGIRWGKIDGNVMLTYLRGFIPEITDVKALVINENILEKIVLAYNNAIAENQEELGNADRLYVNNADELIVTRMYYEPVKANGTYYLVPTLRLIPRLAENNTTIGFYVAVHIFPSTAYGEVRILAGGTSDPDSIGEVPMSMFSEDNAIPDRTGGNSAVYIALFLIVSASAIFGALLLRKHRK